MIVFCDHPNGFEWHHNSIHKVSFWRCKSGCGFTCQDPKKVVQLTERYIIKEQLVEGHTLDTGKFRYIRTSFIPKE